MSRFRPSQSTGGTLAPPRSSGERTPPAPVQATTQILFRPTPVVPVLGNVTPVGGFLTGLMGMYLLMHIIPAAELLFMLLNANLRITLITGLVLCLSVFLSGQLTQFWAAPVSKAWVILYGLFLIASAAGDYPGRSLPYTLEYGIRFHIFPFLICAVAQTGARVRRLIEWTAFGGPVLILLIFAYGQSTEGRLVVPDTSLGNPNDLALSLLMVSLFMIAMLSTRSVPIRVIAFSGLPVALYFILQTGSRASFVTILVVAFFGFLTSPPKVKGVLALVVPLAAVAMTLLLPTATTRRLTMIVTNPSQVYNQSDETRSVVGSQMARQQLQERAIQLTLQNPLAGVGPLMFADAVENMVRENSAMKSSWQNAHNVYLQLAAENGIVAFALFVGIMIWGLRTNFRLYRKAGKEPRLKQYELHTFCLLLIMVCYSFNIAFGNYIYDPGYPILIGLTTANFLAFQKDAAALNPLPAGTRPQLV